MPLETTHSSEVNRLAFAQLSAQTLCPTCIRHSPAVVSARAPCLIRTGIRDLIHLWKFQNRPQLSSLVADLLVNDLPQSARDLGAPESTASQRVLVLITTQWRRQVSRGFDHTWLLDKAIRTRRAEPMAVRSWLSNQRFRPPQHELSCKERLSDAKSRFRAHPKVAGHHITLLDDLMTTSATVRGAADALRHAWARLLEIWCLARTSAPSTAR